MHCSERLCEEIGQTLRKTVCFCDSTLAIYTTYLSMVYPYQHIWWLMFRSVQCTVQYTEYSVPYGIYTRNTQRASCTKYCVICYCCENWYPYFLRLSRTAAKPLGRQPSGKCPSPPVLPRCGCSRYYATGSPSTRRTLRATISSRTWP